MGVPGSGKTTLSQALVPNCRCVYLDNNFIADAFFPDTRMAEEYKALARNIYDALYAIVEANLKLGNSVLLDVPHVTHMQRPEWQAHIQSIAANGNAQLCIVRCYCTERVLWERLTGRAENRDKWKLDNWTEFLSREPIMVEIPFPHLDVDTELTHRQNVNSVLAYLHDMKAT